MRGAFIYRLLQHFWIVKLLCRSIFWTRNVGWCTIYTVDAIKCWFLLLLLLLLLLPLLLLLLLLLLQVGIFFFLLENHCHCVAQRHGHFGLRIVEWTRTWRHLRSHLLPVRQDTIVALVRSNTQSNTFSRQRHYYILRRDTHRPVRGRIFKKQHRFIGTGWTRWQRVRGQRGFCVPCVLPTRRQRIRMRRHDWFGVGMVEPDQRPHDHRHPRKHNDGVWCRGGRPSVGAFNS